MNQTTNLHWMYFLSLSESVRLCQVAVLPLDYSESFIQKVWFDVACICAGRSVVSKNGIWL